MFGSLGYSGWITKGGGSGPPPSGGGYAVAVGIAGAGGNNPVAGETTWTDPDLIGATNVEFSIVNNAIEVVDVDFTFDPSTGTIDRAPNVWSAGPPPDKIIVPYTPAS